VKEQEYFQPELFSLVASDEAVELLDQASLHTVLDMLAVAETADELEILDVLTPAEQQQVWDALPKATRLRLKQLQAGVTIAPSSQSPAQNTVTDALISQSPTVAAASISAIDEPELQVGDRVVLNAKPHLTVTELLAIFEVVRIQDNLVQVKAARMGVRRYPMDWLVLYSRKAEATPPDLAD
jgi:UDP-3-O-[3-hydroxymyristoyl] glucosamine N-acyltransferase